MICAIDPGYTGAIAFLSDDGVLIEIVDMPVIKHDGKTRIVATELAVILDSRSMDIAYLVIERVGARPGQGVTSMFNFGYGAGLVEGIAAALFVPYFHVLPQTWKRQMGVGADKGACRALCQKLWGLCHHPAIAAPVPIRLWAWLIWCLYCLWPSICLLCQRLWLCQSLSSLLFDLLLLLLVQDWHDGKSFKVDWVDWFIGLGGGTDWLAEMSVQFYGEIDR